MCYFRQRNVLSSTEPERFLHFQFRENKNTFCDRECEGSEFNFMNSIITLFLYNRKYMEQYTASHFTLMYVYWLSYIS